MSGFAYRRSIEGWVTKNQSSLLDSVGSILRVPSVLDRADWGPGFPFGRPCAAALEKTLDHCQSLGMRVHNFDGYAGHAEFGPEDAPEYVAVLGHLDVVPAGNGWSRDPWGGEISDGWIWGRGALDDKGPTYAAIAGAQAVLELGIPLRHRIRLIFGCDEENEWRCMDHYFGAAGQPKPLLGFTPDAGFPLYFAEKGAFTAELDRAWDLPEVRAFRAGLAANMVPPEAEAELRAKCTGSVSRLVRRSPDGCGETWYAAGRSAHGATPHKGRNAALRLAQALRSSFESEALDALIKAGALDGSGFSLAGSDTMSGSLTLNLGMVEVSDGRLRTVVNVRFPATWDSESVVDRFRRAASENGWNVGRLDLTPPLYVPLDREPVRTLMAVFRGHTGSGAKPRAMGGRTYATVIQPVGVAFGPSMPGDESRAHQPDERFPVERFLQCANIYGEAIARLAGNSLPND